MSVQFNDILEWVKSNQLVIGLCFSAVIGTMPETLPAFKQFPQWAWSWFRDASKTFLNFRKGLPETPQAPPKKEETGPQQLNG
jgi:hypothetical protein